MATTRAREGDDGAAGTSSSVSRGGRLRFRAAVVKAAAREARALKGGRIAATEVMHHLILLVVVMTRAEVVVVVGLLQMGVVFLTMTLLITEEQKVNLLLKPGFF